MSTFCKIALAFKLIVTVNYCHQI